MQRVLMIDDDPQVSSVLAMAVETLGHKVVVCTDTEKTEEMCAAVKPDLVLLDMMMPGRSGIELIGPVTQLCPGAMICMMTGLIDDELLRKALTAGAWNVFYKPYSLTELAELLELSAMLSEAIRLEQQDASSEETAEAAFSYPGNARFGAKDIELLVHGARRLGAPEDICGRRLPAAAAELLDNARRHGAREQADRNYAARLTGDRSRLSSSVTDTGDGFDWKRAVSGLPARLNGGGAPGLHIVRSLADELTFADRGRVVTAVFKA